MDWFKSGLIASAMAALIVGPAWAGAYNNTYTVNVSEGVANGGFDTANGNPFACNAANVACAGLNYTGPLDFSNNAAQNSGGSGDLNSAFGFTASNTTFAYGFGTVVVGGSTVANFTSLDNFLNSSGSAANYAYGSFYAFDLGVLPVGTVLTITHDDGVSVFQGFAQVGHTVSGPTSVTTDTVTLNATYDTILYYSRQNGTPSILDVSVPEPVSLSLLGTGLLGLGLLRRRGA